MAKKRKQLSSESDVDDRDGSIDDDAEEASSTPNTSDNRFDRSLSSAHDDDEIDESDHAADDDDFDGEEDDESNDDNNSDNDNDDTDSDNRADSFDNSLPSLSLLPEERKAEAKRIAQETHEKVRKTGVIYLSSIPTGMNVAKLREMLYQYGEIGRIYLEPDPKAFKKKKDPEAKGPKNRSKYLEGWVEFKNKKIAKRVAISLNNTMVGGKRRAPYYECLWNIKYLHKFKWSHLTERLAHQKVTRQHRLLQEISQAKRLNKFYVENAEKARMFERIKEKSEKEGKKFAPMKQFTIPQRLTDEEVRTQKSGGAKKKRKGEKKAQEKKEPIHSGGGLSKGIISSLFPGR